MKRKREDISFRCVVAYPQPVRAKSQGAFVGHIVLELWRKALIFLHKVRPGVHYVKDKHVVCHSHTSEAQPILEKTALYAVSVDCS